MTPPRQIRRFVMPADAILRLFKSRPDDAEVLDAYYSPDHDGLIVTVRSSTYAEVPVDFHLITEPAILKGEDE